MRGFRLRGRGGGDWMCPITIFMMVSPVKGSLPVNTNGGGLSYTTESFNLGFDYAWRYMGILGSTNFFTFSIGW